MGRGVVCGPSLICWGTAVGGPRSHARDYNGRVENVTFGATIGLAWLDLAGASHQRETPMRRTTIAVAFLCTTPVWADCPDGVYDFTDLDKKFMIDTVAAVRAALPPAPEGWSVRDPLTTGVRPGAPMPAWTPPSSACKGAIGVRSSLATK